MASIRNLLAKHGIAPSKGLGQCFLADQNVMHWIVEASELTKEDAALEIGPGLGLMTRQLAQAAGLVVAIELDSRMIEVLHQELADVPNLHLIHADLLETDIVGAMADATTQDEEALSYIVVANLPYYITSQAIRQLLEARVPPQRIVLMVQREVAERITAEPGDMSLLALSVQLYGEPRLLRTVPASAFYPRPKVSSAVLRIDLHDEPVADAATLAHLFRLARAAFSQRRKQVHNSLAANLALESDQVKTLLGECDIDPRRRPQTLTIAEWLRLAEVFAA